MNYSIQKIAEVLKGKLFLTDPDTIVKYLLLDSRKVIYPDESMFFAITGKNHDGHRYIANLITAGVKNFVVENPDYVSEDANFIVVDNSLTALQKLAAFHRSNFKYPVIAITGSNGKTIVKEWLYQLLNKRYRIIRSPKSFNSQVGVPLSLWAMGDEFDLCIIEAGISRPGEMERLEQMIRPDIGILTNIGDAHSVGFEHEGQKINEKLKLFKNVSKLITRREEDRLTDLIGYFTEDHPDIQWVNWSMTEASDLQIRSVERDNGSTRLDADYKGKKKSIDVPFIDDASIENCLHCWLVMLTLDIPDREIRENFKGLHAIEMRLKQREGVNDCVLIDDFYNADVKSLTLAIDLMEQQHRAGKKTLILSDILQSEWPDEKLYSYVNAILEEKHIDRLIGIGEGISANQNIFSQKEKAFYTDTEHFITHATVSDFNSETILLKGARPYSFEKISEWLSKKSHKTVLEINLDAIQKNLNYFRSLLEPETKVMVMLKAFGYGSGSHQIARLLQYNGIDFLAVAYADEGVALREEGITTPIMVMNPEASTLDVILDYNLQPNIYNISILKELIDELKERAKASVQIHLEFDTGMHRLGFGSSELETLINTLKDQPQLEVISVFSHLAMADDPRAKDFTKNQILQFRSIADTLESALQIKPVRHILNTPGLLNYPESKLDMVRLGIGIYGIDPSDRTNEYLENVSTLKSYISQIRTVPAGEGISYGRGSVADHERQIAVIPIGYADGYNRLLSNGIGSMRINGNEVKVTGNVCMDMTMVDVSGLNCREGDEVIVFESARDLYEMADKMNTIPYEVLTSVSQRVKREYVRE